VVAGGRPAGLLLYGFGIGVLIGSYQRLTGLWVQGRRGGLARRISAVLSCVYGNGARGGRGWSWCR